MSAKRRKISPLVAGVEQDDVLPQKRDSAVGMASFMSPTKASLAKFHPSLLPRPVSARQLGTSQRLQDTTSRKQLNPTSLRLSASPEREQRFISSFRSRQSPSRASISGREHLSRPPRRSQTPSRPSLSRARASQSPFLQRHTPELTQSPRRPDRDLPVNILEPSTSLFRQASPVPDTHPSTGLPIFPNFEPELPPTPEQLGLEPRPARPQGLVFSSPSQNALRKRITIASSPSNRNRGLPQSSDGALPDHGTRQTSTILITTQNEPSDVGLKSEELAKLQAQVDALESDVGLLKDLVGLHVSPHSTQFDDQETAAKTLSILTSNNPTHKAIPPPPKSLPFSARLALFLPFSKMPSPEPELEPEWQHDSDEDAGLNEFQPSDFFRPLALEDPVPYLRAFVPFSATAQASLILSAEPSQTTIQQHALELRFPQDVLTIKTRMSSDPVGGNILSLQLDSISEWADHELGTWLRVYGAGSDAASAGWACTRYWEVVVKRARFWATCRARYPELVATDDMKSRRTTSRSQKSIMAPHQKRTHRLPTPDDDDSASEEDSPPAVLALSVDDVRRYAGKQSVTLRRGNVVLLLSWQITFEWTGEPRSLVSTAVSLPKSWTEVDERKSLNKIGALFTKLVQRNGILHALSVVVALLFPNENPD